MNRIKISFVIPKPLFLPYDYKYKLASTIQKWIGDNNEVHGNEHLFSFSDLSNAASNGKGLLFENESFIIFSSYHSEIISQLAQGIMKEPSAFQGFIVENIQILPIKIFKNGANIFNPISPVVLKTRREDNSTLYCLFDNEKSQELLRKSVNKKLQLANRSELMDDFEIEFLSNYHAAKTKLIQVKETKVRGSLCPIRINSSLEVASIIWYAGIGNNTSMGFGFLNN